MFPQVPFFKRRILLVIFRKSKCRIFVFPFLKCDMYNGDILYFSASAHSLSFLVRNSLKY